MRFNQNNLPKTRDDLDRFVRENDLRPYGMFAYREREIFIAETDLVTDNLVNCPFGYFQVAWFTTKPDSTEKMDVGRGIDFDAFHDKEEGWTVEAKRQARIETAIQDAKKWIDKGIESGRLNS